MTEAEWLASSDPDDMLRWLRGSDGRKLRLFAVACFRRLSHALTDPRQRQALDTLEAYADGEAGEEARRRAGSDARLALGQFPSRFGIGTPVTADDSYFVSLMLYREFASSWLGHHASKACGGLADAEAERVRQPALLRDIFGNPFRPAAIDPAWLTPDVVALARGIYTNRAFDRMPILADALQDAGCASEDILNHCRDTRVMHVRGCWVVDSVLGKG